MSVQRNWSELLQTKTGNGLPEGAEPKKAADVESTLPLLSPNHENGTAGNTANGNTANGKAANGTREETKTGRPSIALDEDIRAVLARVETPHTPKKQRTETPEPVKKAEAPKPVTESQKPVIKETAAPAPSKPAVERVAPETPAVHASPAPWTEPKRSRTPMIAAAVGAVVLIAGGVSAYVFRDHFISSSKQSAAAPAGAVLQLSVEPQGTGLSIQWNPAAPAVTRAKQASLTILETGQPPQTVPLEADLLKSGHMFYQPASSRTEFRMEVVGPTGEVDRESVLAMSKPPAAGTETTQARVETPAKINAPAIQTPTTLASAQQQPLPQQGTTQQIASVEEPPKPAPAPVRTFVPPPVQQQAAPQQPSAPLLDPAANMTSAPIYNPAAGLAMSGHVAVPQPNAPQHTSVGGRVEPAKLIKRIAPVYPSLAASARLHGSVRFSATIGKDGRLRNIQTVSGQPILAQAAKDAVQQWVYQPSTLNGQPIEVTTQIEVDFSARQ